MLCAPGLGGGGGIPGWIWYFRPFLCQIPLPWRYILFDLKWYKLYNVYFLITPTVFLFRLVMSHALHRGIFPKIKHLLKLVRPTWTNIQQWMSIRWHEATSWNSNRGDMELKQRCFWAMHVNRKWGLLTIYMPWRQQICIAKFFFSCKNDLPKRFKPNLTAQSVADPGGGARGAQVPPLFLDESEGWRAEKNFFCRPSPPYLRVWMTAPPPYLDPPLPMMQKVHFQLTSVA